MEERTDTIQLIDGGEKIVTINKLSVKKRNMLLNKFINLTKFMQEKDTEEANLLSFIKEECSILDFTTEAIEKSIKGLDLELIDGNECDRLFEKHSGYMLGLNSKN